MTDSSDNGQSPNSDDRLIEAAKRQARDGDSKSPSPGGQPTRTLRNSVASAKMSKEIGRYHVKRVIASGGMGTVYEAIQEHLRRTVAVKVMKHGIASHSAMWRFEYESQILPRLRHHPHTAINGKAPDGVYFRSQPANRRPRTGPRKHRPRRSSCAEPCTLIAERPDD